MWVKSYMKRIFTLASAIFLMSSSSVLAGDGRGVRQQYIDRNVFMCMQEITKGQDIENFKFRQSTPEDIDECLNQYGVEINFEDISKLPTNEELNPKQKKMFEDVEYFKLNEKGVEMLKAEIKDGSFHEAPLDYLGLEKKQPKAKVTQGAKNIKKTIVESDNSDSKATSKGQKRPTFVVPKSGDKETTAPKPVFIR
jgi:hypothetical protein